MILHIPSSVRAEDLAHALASISLVIDGKRAPDGSHRAIFINSQIAALQRVPPCNECGEPASIASHGETWCAEHYQDGAYLKRQPPGIKP